MIFYAYTSLWYVRKSYSSKFEFTSRRVYDNLAMIKILLKSLITVRNLPLGQYAITYKPKDQFFANQIIKFSIRKSVDFLSKNQLKYISFGHDSRKSIWKVFEGYSTSNNT